MTLDPIRQRVVSLLRGGLGAAILVNAVLPWLVYTWAQPDLGRVHALMASALPPIAWSVIQLVRKKRIDALSMFALAGIGLSLAAFFGGGLYRMLGLREHRVTGVIGLAVLGSVAVNRPMVIVLARARNLHLHAPGPGPPHCPRTVGHASCSVIRGSRATHTGTSRSSGTDQGLRMRAAGRTLRQIVATSAESEPTSMSTLPGRVPGPKYQNEPHPHTTGGSW